MENIGLAILGAAFTAGSVLIAYLAYRRGLKQDTYNEAENDATLKSDIQYIKRRSDDMVLEQREMNKTVSALSERMTRCEESTKSAHRRLDELGGKHE